MRTPKTGLMPVYLPCKLVQQVQSQFYEDHLSPSMIVERLLMQALECGEK